MLLRPAGEGNSGVNRVSAGSLREPWAACTYPPSFLVFAIVVPLNVADTGSTQSTSAVVKPYVVVTRVRRV